MKRRNGVGLIAAVLVLSLAFAGLSGLTASASAEPGTPGTGTAVPADDSSGDPNAGSASDTASTAGDTGDQAASGEGSASSGNAAGAATSGTSSASSTADSTTTGSAGAPVEAPAAQADTAAAESDDRELTAAGYTATPTYVLSADERSIEITVSLPYADVEKVYFPLWSRQAVGGNAQDDIVWYEGKRQSDGTWTVTVPLDRHHSTGPFDLHCYALVNGQMQLVGNTWFLVDAPTATLAVTAVDTTMGTYTVTLSGITCFPGVTKVQLPTWVKDDQSDIKWYTATKQSDGTYTFTIPMSDHAWTAGTYKTHAYITDGNGAMTRVGTVEQDMAVPASTVTATLSADEKTATIKATIPMNATQVLLPVWSSDKGQDDIVWYKATKQSDGTWTATVPVSKHKGTGAYQVHCYATVDGAQVFGGNTTFSVAAPTATVSVTSVDAAKGTYTVTVSGINAPSGVTKVQIPTWVNANQSDIKWYTATKQSDGTYTYTVSMADHAWTAGTYKSHAYVTDGNGNMTRVGTLEQDMALPPVTVTATPNATETTVHVSAIIPMTGVTEVRFPTWSEAGGQDDVVWYTAKKQSDGTWAVDVPVSSHRTAGQYQVHCYAKLAGSLKGVGSTTFNITAPTATVDITNYDAEAGTFEVNVSSVNCPSGVATVQVPTWVNDNQSDIKWYRANAQDSTTYTYTVSMGEHQWLTGTYKSHCYITGNNGVRALVGNDTQVVTLPSKPIFASISADEKTASVFAVAPSASSVSFPVWSEKNGQDDIRWYSATKNSQGVWVATIPISNHKTDGKYQVHGYANNNKDFIGGTSFNVTPITGTIQVQNVQPKKGTFDVVISGITSPSGVTRVQIPIWTTSNQSDIHWYEAELQADGTWKATMNIGRHGYHDGTFKIHCYVTGGNGVSSCIGGTSQYMDVVDYINVTGIPGSGRRTIILKDPSVPCSSVQFPVWTAAGGQDDIVWYNATNQGNGMWTATINCGSMKHDGQCIAHCYANNSTLLGATTFDVIHKDIVSDLRGCYIMVNKQACCITIYTAAGVPVKAFICSPGDATPLGTFYSPAKYRWKLLIGPSWGQYCTRITDGFLIHSVGGSAPNPYSISASDYNALGSRVSHGCVRVTVADAKWIYENCAPGVRITIYESPNPGPLGKPGHIIIPSWQNWDPTDPACPENW